MSVEYEIGERGPVPLLTGTFGAVVPCPAGYRTDIVCPACVGVTADCQTVTDALGRTQTCCRCVGSCVTDHQPPSDDGGATTPVTQDPWARLADVISAMGGGGLLIAPPPEPAVTYAPVERRTPNLWGLGLLLAGVAGGGYWYWQQRQRRS